MVLGVFKYEMLENVQGSLLLRLCVVLVHALIGGKLSDNFKFLNYPFIFFFLPTTKCERRKMQDKNP